MKQCTKCKNTKPREEFGKKARNTDGLDSWCKACVSAAKTGRPIVKATETKPDRIQDFLSNYPAPRMV